MRVGRWRGVTLALMLGGIAVVGLGRSAHGDWFHTIPRTAPAYDLRTGGPYYAPPIPYGHYVKDHLGAVHGAGGYLKGLPHSLHAKLGGKLHGGCHGCGKLHGDCHGCGKLKGKLKLKKHCGHGCEPAFGAPLYGDMGPPMILGPTQAPIGVPQVAPQYQSAFPTSSRPASDLDPEVVTVAHTKPSAQGPGITGHPFGPGHGLGLGHGLGHGGLGHGLGGKMGKHGFGHHDPCADPGCDPCKGKFKGKGKHCGHCLGAGCGKCSKILGHLHGLHAKALGHLHGVLPFHGAKYFVGPGGPVPLTPGYVPYVVPTRAPRDFLAFPPYGPLLP